MADKITMNAPQTSDYKGNAVISLNPQGRASISFGLGKAMVIVENLPAILAFLKSDGKNCDVKPGVQAVVDDMLIALGKAYEKKSG
jgi:hypothetical protein